MLSACLVGGCDTEPSPDEEGMATESEGAGPSGTPGTAVLLLEFDPQPACNTVGVTGVQLVAQQIGCESPPPAPCTMPANPPTIAGDQVTCPSTDSSRLLGVDLTTPGRYAVRTVASTADVPQEVCRSLDGESEVLVTAEAVEAGSTLTLDAGEADCP